MALGSLPDRSVEAETVQLYFPGEGLSTVSNTMRQEKEFYTEQEAAESLGISKQRLHSLLDQHVFHEGLERPEQLNFLTTDLVLISIWHRDEPANIVRMPRRKA